MALALGRLLPRRVRQKRVWSAGEKSVSDRRDELRWDTDMRPLLEVVSEADQLRLGPTATDEGDPDGQSRVVACGNGDVGVARYRGRGRRAHEVLEVAVEVTFVRVVVRRPCRTVRQGDDRVEVV